MVAASTAPNRGRRWINDVLMRLMDIQFAFPAVVLAVVVASAFGQSLWTLLLVLTVVYTPIMARYIRAAVLDQMAEDYVSALRRQWVAPSSVSCCAIFPLTSPLRCWCSSRW